MSGKILIDGSYYIFFRYFALIQSYKIQNKLELLETEQGVKDFLEKFDNVFVKKIAEIKSKLKMKGSDVVVALDCPRKSIWRKELFPDYKEHRESDLSNVGAYIFNRIRIEKLFGEAGVNLILKHDNLEADDCIALYLKRVCEPNKKFVIVASDMDYLQIAENNICIINLKYQDIRGNKSSYKNKDKDLFCKIVSGDKSDGIPSVFKKCGPKTAEKYYENRELFEKKLSEDSLAKNQYELNCKLIDFSRIPERLVEGFNQKYFGV